MTTPKWRRWLRLRGPNPRADVADEFAFHMEERIEALVASGMTPDAARAKATAQFGDIARAAAICTDIGERRADRVRWTERLQSVAQDLRYAAQAMLRSPGFTAATVLTIALGIGANTVVFSLLNALLFQPLDAERPRELVRVYTSESSVIRDDRDRFGGSSYADYADLRSTPSLRGLAAWAPFGATVTYAGATSRSEARVVSDNYFALIGRPLLRGVPPTAIDEVVISHHFWRTTLGSSPSALGATITVSGRPMRVAGIAAEDFRGIEPSTIHLYLPMSALPGLVGRPGILSGRAERSLKMIGRLAPAATASSAERDLNERMKAIAATYPESNDGRQISVRRAASIIAPESTGGALYPVATLVFAATIIMLLIAGVNVAAVLLSRTVRRRREIAVRLSLGASRPRIARQLLTESLLLAGLASVIVIAIVLTLPIIAANIGVPSAVQPHVDVRVLGYALLVTLTAGVLFGIAPALSGTRADVVDALRITGGDGRQSSNRIQRALVVAQLAMSMLLLVVGSALLDSLDRQQRVDPGFRAENLLAARFEDPLGRFDAERERTFTRLAVERLATIPGVRSVTVASMAPLSGEGFRSTIHIPGYEPAPNESMDVAALTAGPEMFRTLGIPLLRGRELTWADRDTTPKVVINDAMARRYWPSREAVGSFVQLGGRGGTTAQVIAVVGDARFYSLAEPPRPMFTIQRVTGGGPTVLIRTTDDPARLIPAIRGLMSGNDNPLTLMQLETMQDGLRNSLVVSRVVSTVILGIGVLAILLASVGLYGVVSYAMAGRSREFGVRMALGATREQIMRLVVGYGSRLAAIGGAIGLVLGIAATRLMRGMLFGDSSALIAVVSVTLILGTITLIASLVPARRATAVSPAASLRSD